ncbi:MAG: IS110 family transposase [Spirochaetales bacterium]|jgi:transposase|nr:IS110 family transposase [Spirochaetales bacterium]
MIVVGIDIAKHEHVAALLDWKPGPRASSGKDVCKIVKFRNNRNGFLKLMANIKGFAPEFSNVMVGMEATGHYWMALYAYLKKQGLANVFSINPMVVKAFRGAEIRKTKTDPLDARLIAKTIAVGDLRVSRDKSESYMLLQKLCRLRLNLVREQTKFKVEILTVLDTAFPEYTTVWSKGRVFLKSSLRLLSKYSTAKEMAEAGSKRIETLLQKASRNRVDSGMGEELKKAAIESVYVEALEQGNSLEMKFTVEKLKLVELQIANIEQKIEQLYDSLRLTLHTVNGIGKMLAASLASEIGEISQYSNPKTLVALAGIDPTVSQSGMSEKKGMKISKRGSKYLREYVYLAAFASLCQNSALRMKYNDYVSNKHKHHNQALIAVGRKILNICFYLMKTGENYVMIFPQIAGQSQGAQEPTEQELDSLMSSTER